MTTPRHSGLWLRMSLTIDDAKSPYFFYELRNLTSEVFPKAASEGFVLAQRGCHFNWPCCDLRFELKSLEQSQNSLVKLFLSPLSRHVSLLATLVRQAADNG